MSDLRVSTFGDLHRSVDDMFRHFSRDLFDLDPLPAITGEQENGPVSVWANPMQSMKMDVIERDDHFAVHVDLPGVPKEEVKISLEGNMMTIAAERSEERNEERENYHLKERKFGKMSRSIQLPKDVDLDHADAKFNNGELEITLPRLTKRSEQIKTINIE
jgi:HSP20 family protein